MATLFLLWIGRRGKQKNGLACSWQGVRCTLTSFSLPLSISLLAFVLPFTFYLLFPSKKIQRRPRARLTDSPGIKPRVKGLCNASNPPRMWCKLDSTLSRSSLRSFTLCFRLSALLFLSSSDRGWDKVVFLIRRPLGPEFLYQSTTEDEVNVRKKKRKTLDLWRWSTG